jgi:predicted metalloprotease with PDZ domain
MRFPLAFVDTGGVRTVSLAGAQGLVGTELLRRLSIVLDYRRERAILRPTRRLQTPFCRNASGVCFERAVTTGAARVSFLEPRSPAARSGLTLGDVLISVDGIPVTELSDRDIDARFDQSGAVHTVEVRRGPQTAGRPTTPTTRGRAAPRPPITVTVRWRL